MKTLAAITSSSFMVYKAFEHYVVLPNLFTGYFEDFIALPLVLSIASILLGALQPGYQIGKRDVIVVWVLFVVHFECIMPAIDPRFTFDILDMFVYALGARLFLFYQENIAPNYARQ